MLTFRVRVVGVLEETWEVQAHDIQDAITRVQAAEGNWVDAAWVGEPRHTARLASQS